jgi:DUF4097 and DUF4098 domain-containing protein YvlB
MTLTTRTLTLVCLAGLVPAGAAAQGLPVPVPAAAHATWFERYQDSRHGPEQTETWSRTFKVGPNGSLDLTNLAGEVVVTGGPGEEIRVDATKRVRARDAAAAKQLLSSLTIDAVENGGRVEVRTVYPRTHDISAEVDFTVQLPATAALSVHTVSGDIRVSKVKGEARLESVSGNIVASEMAKVARLKSVSGDVEISDGGAADSFAAGTVSGSLLTRRIKARAMDIQTVSGDVTLEDVTCDRAQVRSVSGDVEYDGPLSKGGRYEFTSHSGDLRVAIAGSTGFEITANTFSGEVRSELPSLKISSNENDLPGNHEVRATIGDGSALLVVKTFSGDLVVTGPAKAKDKDKRKDKE